MDGGNAFGGPATLGTMDANSLVLVTDGATALTITTSQNATFAGAVTATSVAVGTAGAASGSIIFYNGANANTATIMTGVTSASYAVTWPAAQGAAGTTLTNNGSGVLSWATASGADFFADGGNNFGASATLGTTGAGQTLTVVTAGTTAFVIDASQNAIFSGGALSSKNNTLDTGGSVGNAVFHGTLTTGSSSATATNGAIIFGNAATAFTATIMSGATAASYSVTWPTAQGGAGTVLTNNGAGVLTWASAGAGGAFVNGGNTFGAAATLGTNDDFSLTFMTHGLPALTINTGQVVAAAAGITSGTTGSIGGSVSLLGSTTGIFVQSVPATVTTYAITWPASVASVAGSYLTSSASGILAWTSPAAAGFFVNGGNAFANPTLGTNATGSGSLSLTSGAGITALVLAANQAATFPGSGAITSVTVGTSGTTTGSVTLQSAGGGALTQTVSASASTPYTITWPAAVAAVSNSILTSTTGGVLTWSSGAGTNFFVNGGNAFSNPTLGTTGAGNSLTLITGAGVNALVLSAAQAATFPGSGAAALVTVGASGTTTGSLLLTSATGGTLTITVPAAGVTSYSITWPSAVATATGSFLTSTAGGALSWTAPASTSFFVNGGNAFTNPTLGTTGAGNSLTLITGAGVNALVLSAAQAATFPGSGITAAVTVGANGTTTGSLLLASAAGGALTQTVPAAGVTSYAITWPAAAASVANSFLTSSTGGVLSWTAASSTSFFVQGGNTFGAQAVLGTLDANSLKVITNSSQALLVTAVAANAVSLTVGLGGSTAGSLILANATNTNTFTQAGPVATASYAVTWPPAQATSNAVLTNNSGVMAWALDASAAGYFKNGGNAFTAPATLGATSSFGLSIITNNVNALVLSSSQAATFPGSGATAIVTVGTNAATTGSLLLTSAAGGVLTQTVASGGMTSYSVAWPTAQATVAGQVLSNNGAGVLSWVTAATAATAFLQSGNAFGATAVLGTTDNNPFTLITNNVLALTVSTSQNATFAGTVSAKTSLLLTGATAGALTQSAPATVTSYAATWPAAAPASNAVISMASSGVMAYTLDTAAAGYFKNGGNAFSASPATFGPSNATTLEFLGAGSVIGSINSAGSLWTIGVPLQLGNLGGSPGNLVFTNSSTSNSVTLQTGATSTSYSLTLPLLQGAASSVLTNNGSGVLTWTAGGAAVYFQQSGNAFGATAVLGTTDSNPLTLVTNSILALTISTSQNATFAGTVSAKTSLLLAGATAGALTLSVPATVTSYAVTWPAAAPTSNAVVTVASSGVMAYTLDSAATGYFKNGGNAFSASPASIGPTTATTLEFLGSGSVIGSISSNGALWTIGVPLQLGNLGGSPGNLVFTNNVTSNTVTLQTGATSTSYSLFLPLLQGAASSVLTNNGSGVLTWAAGGAAVYFQQSGNAFAATAVLGTTDNNPLTLVTNGTLALTVSTSQNATFAGTVSAKTSYITAGSTSGMLTQSVPATVTSYAVTWPAAQATATGQVLTNNGSGVLSWAAAGAGAFFQQSGNAFAATAVLGTTDNNPLTVITNNVLALTVSTSQNATFAGTVSAKTSLLLAGATSGTLTQSVPATVTSYAVTWPAAVATSQSTLSSDSSGNLSWYAPNVVQAAATAGTPITSTTFVITGPTVTITLRSVTSKVLIQASSFLSCLTPTSGSSEASLALGSTELTGQTNGMAQITSTLSGGDIIVPCSLVYLHSPASTAALTYSVCVRTTNAANTVAWGNSTSLSTIICTEIPA